MGDRPDSNRQELQSALDAVTTTFAVGRPVSPGSTPAPVGPPGPVDGKQELATAYDKLVEHEAAKPTALIPPPIPIWRRYLQPAIIVVCLTLAVYLTVTEPAWLYPTFDVPEAPSTEASGEQVMVATSLLIELYQQESGRLPTSLSEIEGSFPSVSMIDTGAGSYQLLSTIGGRSLVMTVTPGQDATFEGGSR